MDSRAIGVFDSGIGGLTVLRALKRRLPHESTVYLGDTARVPYGTRSAATVVKYAINNARTLCATADLKLLVIACNTATAFALPALQEAMHIPVVGVIEPGARAALSSTKGGTIVVLGTAGTVRSQAYNKALTALGVRGDVVARACPLLVPLVEEGWTSGDIPRRVVEKYLEQLPARTDVVVMGCTHFPLLAPVLRAALPAHVALVDGAEATAVDVEELLRAHDQLHTGTATHRLLVTDAPEQMAALSPLFLGEAVDSTRIELVDVQMTA